MFVCCCFKYKVKIQQNLVLVLDMVCPDIVILRSTWCIG